MDPRSHDDDFFEALASPSPTPGGGVAAARAGRLGCALLCMVTGITIERASRRARRAAETTAKRPSTEESAALERVGAIRESVRDLSSRLRTLEDADRTAFESFLEATRLPRQTEEEKSARIDAQTRAARSATEVPLEMLEAARDIVTLGVRLLEIVGAVSLRAESDLFGAMELAKAAYRTAELNVRVNWSSLTDSDAADLRPRWDEVARTFRASWVIVEEALPRLLPSIALDGDRGPP